MEKNFKRKFLLIFLGILILIVGGIGVSYGYWNNSETQNTFDVLGVKCFELTMTKETEGIHLEEAYPVTDEEGKEQEGYTFTIKNTCNTTAYYQVNLEENNLGAIKRLDNKYIKVSLNDSKGKNLDTYQETETTINEKDFQADDSHILTTGSLEPDGEANYTLKLWMDEETPPIEEVMNATFESKISVVATYIEEEKRNNTITIDYQEPSDYAKDKETVTFTVKSEKEDINITEYSLDGTSYNSLDEPNTEVTVPLEFTEENDYTIYFRDQMGNKKEQEFSTNKLDQTGPIIDVTETSNESGAVLNITFSDAKSGLKEYRIEDGVSSIDLEEEWTEFTEENHQITVNYQENKTITIYGKDNLGNISTKEFTITKADTKGPELTIHNPKADTWSNTSVTITLSATDDISGVDKFYYSTDDGDTKTWNEISDVELNDKTGTTTFKIETEYNGKYYFKVKDKLGNESEPQETTVMIDLSAPTQKFELDNNFVKGDNDWYKSASITVTGTDIGGSQISGGSYCEGTTNCEPTTSFNGTNQSITLSDGTNRVVCATFSDGAGNTSAKQCSSTYNVDGEAPTISDLIAPTVWGTSNTLTAKVEDTISGIAGYDFSTNEEASENLENVSDAPKGEQTFTKDVSENNTWYLHVKDVAGNVSKSSVTVNRVDNGLPSSEFKINSSADGDNDWYKTTPTITVTATDEQSGVSKVESCTTTESSCTSYEDLVLDENDGATSRKGTVTLPDGDGIKVCVKVTDIVGKTSTKCSEGYKIDSTPPNISDLKTQNTWGTINTLTGVVTDSLSGIAGYRFSAIEATPTVEWTLDNNHPTGSTTYTASATSNTTWYFHVKDQAGNVSRAEVNVNKVDNGAPNDPTFQIQSQTPGTSGSGWYQVLKLRVTLSDNQSGVSSAKYCVDTKDCNPTLTANLSESGTSKTFDVDFGSNTSAQKVCVTVTDAVGLTKTKCDSNTYKVDGTVPDNPSFSITTANGNDGWYKTTKPTLTVTVKDTHSGVASAKYCTTTSTQCNNYNTNISLNGSNGGTTRIGTIQLPEGNGIKACVQVTDVSGKTSAKCSDGYKVDITPPTVGSVTGKLNGTSITFTASVTENGSGIKSSGYSFAIKNGSASVGTYTSNTNTYNYTSGVRGQSYTATVTVTDNAGNVSSSVSSGQVTIPYPTAADTLKGVQIVSSGDGLYEVTHTDQTAMDVKWQAKELRYGGQEPNNYVTFNNEVAGWRIVGLVNVKTTSGIQQRIKIIRKDSIGDKAWDTTGSSDWTQSSLMKELNEGGTYYNSLNATAKGMIATDIIWNIGGSSTYKDVTVSLFYERERGTDVPNGGKSEWNPGKQSIAIPYPSDYGYATNGGSMGRDFCISERLYLWDSGSAQRCAYTVWLWDLDYTWLLMPYGSTFGAVFSIIYDGQVTSVGRPGDLRAVYPTLYLSPSVGISGGQGTSAEPYTLVLS